MEMKINSRQAMIRPIIPPECEPVNPKDNPPEIIKGDLGTDGRQWHMWGRVCDRLAECGRVCAPELVYDGWVGEKMAVRFLRLLQIRGLIVPDGRTYLGTRQGMVEYTVYRKAS